MVTVALRALPALILLASCASGPAVPLPDTEARVDHVKSLLDSWHGNAGVLEPARDELDEILAQDPKSAAAHLQYTRYHIMSGYLQGTEVAPESLAAAENSLNTAIRLSPDNSNAYVLAGHLYWLQGRHQQAKDALTKAEALGSTEPWLQLNWADILVSEGDYEGAFLRYRSVRDSNTPNTNAMDRAFGGLIAYYKSKHLDGDTDRTYRERIAFSPDVAWYYGNYGQFLLCRLDNHNDAITQFRTALDKMSYGLATSGLAAALYGKWAFGILEEEDPSTVAEAFREAQQLWPGDAASVVESVCKVGRVIERVKLATRVATIKQSVPSQ